MVKVYSNIIELFNIHIYYDRYFYWKTIFTTNWTYSVAYRFQFRRTRLLRYETTGGHVRGVYH